jgi:RimJ/RimL family protein N-acetyltransferase
MRVGGQPILDPSPELRLRPWRGSDVPAVLDVFADPQIRHWHMRAMGSEDEARVWIEAWSGRWSDETDGSWAVVDPETDHLRGQVALRSVNREFGHGHITYWTCPQVRGRGIAVSAVEAVSRWALGELGLHRLEIHHSTANASSCRVAEKAGFDLEGVMRSALLHMDGWHDMHVHARIRVG